MIRIENLSVTFEDQKIFQNFSFHIEKGEKIALVGESGKGKSTLLNVLTGFIPQFSGAIYIDDIELNVTNIKKIRKKISWVPQDTNLNFDSVKDLLYTPFEFHVNKRKKPTEKDVLNIFSKLLLTKDILYKKVKEISGGQKQRVILTGSLLLNKPILFVDEPTSALDEESKKAISDYVLSNKELTVLAATHDEYWAKFSDRILEL